MSAQRKSAAATDSFAQIKELMLAEEQHELEELRTRLEKFEEETAERIAENLAEALRRRRELGEESFDGLVDELQEATEAAIQQSVSRDKSRLTTALFPIMGPAVRNYVGDLFRGMVEELNEVVKNTTSVERIRWRAQAKMAGKSYSEYVLLKTQRFEIEEVYLIEKDSGLLLMHVATDPENEAHAEADLVSGMFTAIRSFVKDSFASDSEDGGKNEDEELESFTFGEREVLIEEGPSMVLAAVAVGVPAPSVRDQLCGILENLHAEMQEQLEDFSGDISQFEPQRPELRKALIQNLPTEDAGGGMWRAWVVLGLLIAGIGTWIFFEAREQNRWDNFEAALRSKPGIAITEVKDRGWFWQDKRDVVGLRDPLAVVPETFAEETGIDTEKTAFRFSLMHSLDPEIATRREAEAAEKEQRILSGLTELETRLAESKKEIEMQLAEFQPLNTAIQAAATEVSNVKTEVAGLKEGMTAEKQERTTESKRLVEALVRSQFGSIRGLEIDFQPDGTIAFSGSVAEPQFSSLKQRLESLGTIGKVDLSTLKNGTEERIDQLVTAFAGTTISYVEGSTEHENEERSGFLCDYARELYGLTPLVGQTCRFEIQAHPLIGQNREENRKVEQQRADEIREWLIDRGVAPDDVEATLSEDQQREGQGVRIVPKITRTETP
ncbi:MAG: hypothetical protein HKN23_12730 [Verrucomicrobiales bacterium]|nr:hypothetical protein [Verrucomicrobiales bacterium]